MHLQFTGVWGFYGRHSMQDADHTQRMHAHLGTQLAISLSLVAVGAGVFLEAVTQSLQPGE